MDQLTQQSLEAILLKNAQLYAQDEFLARGIGVVYTGLHRFPEATKEALFHWMQPGNVGNTGGPSPKPHGEHSWTAGDPALFSCKGIPGQEDNFYFYSVLPELNRLPSRVFDYRTFQIDILNPWQALEFEQHIIWNGRAYNMAWQADIAGSKTWRYFDYVNNRWVTALPFATTDFTKPFSVVAEYALTPYGVTHVALSINGLRSTVAVQQLTKPVTGKNKHTIAFQVDPKHGMTCDLTLHDVEARYV